MKNIFDKALVFIKENPSIIYSLFLVILIPAAFFLNIYMINSGYEKDLNKITQRKAVLVEDIINVLLEEQLGDFGVLQSSIGKLAEKNSEIISLSILQHRPEQDSFEIVASKDESLIGLESDEIQNTIAWKQPEGVAFLDRGKNGRFWKVTKILAGDDGEKKGLISISFSLSDTDALINRTITNSYWILIITILVVVLMISNQTRLFGYALTLSKLKEIDKMKDTFISMASHELRSPLTAIKGYLEFLQEKKEVLADKDSQHYVTNISTSVERLQNLVNDILEVSRIEGNRLPVEITEFVPHETILQSVEELRAHAIQKGLALTYEPGETTVPVKADINRLKQIIVNLIGNAIKYTEKGSIKVTVQTKDKKLLITVADTGLGISAENQAKLFQKFYRVPSEKTKNILGTGLGLWITLELAKRMDSQVTVESIEGVGSHFTLHLPIAKA